MTSHSATGDTAPTPLRALLGLALLGGLLGAALGCSADDGGIVAAGDGEGGGDITAGVGGAGGGGVGGAGGEDAWVPTWKLPPTVCPADMVWIGGSCMDRYEAPNIEGAEPLAMQTALDGEAWCAERGKRMCQDVEWIAACEGSEQWLYPYGEEHEPHRCNDDKVWISPSWTTLASWPSEAAQAEAAKLYQADPSGSRGGCKSEAGVFDLTGNVAEWVVRTIPNSNNYDHVMKGCYWAGCYGGTKPNCSFTNPAHPSGFRSYEAGFRCCADVE